jgi:hypothetical protein
MQKILDRTQASLAEAFASLARNAKRQQSLYLTAIVTLMAIVVFSALLLAVLAADKQHRRRAKAAGWHRSFDPANRRGAVLCRLSGHAL